MKRKKGLVIMLAIVAGDIAVIHFLFPQLIDQSLAVILWSSEVVLGLIIYRLDRTKKHTPIKNKPDEKRQADNKQNEKHQADLVDVLKKLVTIKSFERKDHVISLKVKMNQNLEDFKKSETEPRGIVWQDIFDVSLVPKFIGHLQSSEYHIARKDWNELLDLCTRHNNMLKESSKSLEASIKKEMQKNFPDYEQFDHGIPFRPWYDTGMATLFVFGNMIDLVRGQKNALVMSSKEEDSRWTIVGHSAEDDYIIAVSQKDDTASIQTVLTGIRDSFQPDLISGILSIRDKIKDASQLVQKDVEKIIKDSEKGVTIKGTCGLCRK